MAEILHRRTIFGSGDDDPITTDFNDASLCFGDLDLEEKPFAAGGSGQIYRGTFKGNINVAAKCTFDSMFHHEHDELRREFDVLSRLRHPNILRIFGTAVDEVENRLYIVTEYCDGGDLSEHATRNDTSYTPERFARIVTQVLSAVQYMHDVGIAHLDLKPFNVLIAQDLEVRVCDLGGAQTIQKAILGNIGTACYMPPEAFALVALDDVYDPSKWDIYSLAVLIVELWHRRNPWFLVYSTQIKPMVIKGLRPDFPPSGKASPADQDAGSADAPLGLNPPPELRALVYGMWAKDPSARPNIAEVCSRFRPIAAELADRGSTFEAWSSVRWDVAAESERAAEVSSGEAGGSGAPPRGVVGAVPAAEAGVVLQLPGTPAASTPPQMASSAAPATTSTTAPPLSPALVPVSSKSAPRKRASAREVRWSATTTPTPSSSSSSSSSSDDDDDPEEHEQSREHGSDDALSDGGGFLEKAETPAGSNKKKAAAAAAPAEVVATAGGAGALARGSESIQSAWTLLGSGITTLLDGWHPLSGTKEERAKALSVLWGRKPLPKPQDMAKWYEDAESSDGSPWCLLQHPRKWRVEGCERLRRTPKGPAATSAAAAAAASKGSTAAPAAAATVADVDGGGWDGSSGGGGVGEPSSSFSLLAGTRRLVAAAAVPTTVTTMTFDSEYYVEETKSPLGTKLGVQRRTKWLVCAYLSPTQRLVKCVEGFASPDEAWFPFALATLRLYSIQAGDGGRRDGTVLTSEPKKSWRTRQRQRRGSTALPARAEKQDGRGEERKGAVAATKEEEDDQGDEDEVVVVEGQCAVNDQKWQGFGNPETGEPWPFREALARARIAVFDLYSPSRSRSSSSSSSGGGGCGGSTVRVKLRDLPFRVLNELGPGFFNARAPFKVLGGLVDAGNHMSVLRLRSGRFLVAGALDPNGAAVGQAQPGELRLELDRLTRGGALIEAVVATHPFHTLGFTPFYNVYGGAGLSVDNSSSSSASPPISSDIKYYGTPRHLRRLRSIPWVGDVSDPAVQRLWEAQGVHMRLPRGTEFANPKPPEVNHISSVFVFHVDSRCLHNDDCLCYYDQPVKKMGVVMLALGVKHDMLAFHQSFRGAGLTDPKGFEDWMDDLVEDWPFECLCTAHNGRLFKNANARVRTLLEESRDELAAMAAETPSPEQGPRILSEEERRAGAWSPNDVEFRDDDVDPDTSNSCECG